MRARVPRGRARPARAYARVISKYVGK